MDDDMPTYSHTPISADEEIRVLELEPALSFAAPLVASLFVRKLYQDLDLAHPLPEYHCVSYCWGTQQDIESMFCNNQRLQISGTVDVMLRHLRKAVSPRNLWVDAICINQSDDTEKEIQVGIMSTIYQLANKVHVWLGPATVDDHVPTVFAALKMLALLERDSPETYIEGDVATLKSSVNSFLTRQWYSRRWILQEVKSARTVTVHCGHHRIPWEWVRDGIQMLLDVDRDSRDHESTSLISTATALALAGFGSLSFFDKERKDIFSLLWEYHTSNCSDERDRIFALYGLLPAHVKPISSDRYFNATLQCPINYQKHFSETYIQLAAAGIKSGRVATIIDHAIMFGSLSQQNPDWPSWVPAWNRMRIPANRISSDVPRESARLDESGNTPRLILKGPLFRINTVQIAGTSADVFEFFNADKWQSGIRSELSWTLYKSAHFAGLRYDHEPLNTRDILPEKYWKLDSGAKSYFLRPCISRELNSLHHNDFSPEYSAQLLREEIRRVTNGLALFQFGRDKSTAPGIAFAEVRIGDFIFSIASPDFRLQYKLVLRQVQPSKGKSTTPSAFHLVGCCFCAMKHRFDSKDKQALRQDHSYTTVALL